MIGWQLRTQTLGTSCAQWTRNASHSPALSPPAFLKGYAAVRGVVVLRGKVARCHGPGVLVGIIVYCSELGLVGEWTRFYTR